MTTSKNLIKMANRGNKTLNTTPTKIQEPHRKETEVIVEKKLTPEEERDIKAKQRVEELLSDSPLNITKTEDLIELDDHPTDQPTGSIEWLEEQISKLSEENETLKVEILQAKEDYSKIFQDFQRMKNSGDIVLNNSNDDTQLKSTLVKLFNEIQSNYFNMLNPMSGKSNLVIPPLAFMNRLILFFPFLEDQKKY